MAKPSYNAIRRNTVINLIGAIVPLFISLLTVPLYLQLIGNVRYGVLAIIWLILGYFGVFDLGLGKAISNQIARLHNVAASEREIFFWTALCLNAILGLVGGLILLISGQFLFGMLFRMPDEMRGEVLSALPWVAVAVPVVTVSFVLTGSLEGREKFFTLNLVTTFSNILMQLLPLSIALLFGPKLSWLVGTNVIIRLAGIILLFLSCRKYLPLMNRFAVDPKIVGSLFRYGGWIAVTGIIGPILTSVDQVIIGAQAGVQAVTFYIVPFNLVSYVSILPSSLARTLFPHFSKLERQEAQKVGEESCRVLAAVLTPVIVVGIIGLKPFLEIWLGPKMAATGGIVGEILLIGIWINSLAFIPYSLIQGQGRPDLVAKFHLLELAPHLLALWIGLTTLGLAGAAWAWVLRVALDAVLLFWASQILLRILKTLWPAFLLMLATFIATFTLFDLLLWRVVIGSGLLLATVIWSMRVNSPQIKAVFARLPIVVKKAGSQS